MYEDMVDQPLPRHKREQHGADAAEHEARAPEDIDRLGLIAAHEPDGQQIQQHFERSSEPILAASARAGTMIDGHFNRARAKRFDQHSEKSMHLAVKVQLLG